MTLREPGQATKNMISIPPLRHWQAEERAVHGTQDKRAIFADPRMGKSLSAAVTMIDNPTDRTVLLTPRTVGSQWYDILTSTNTDWEVHKAYNLPSEKARKLLLSKPPGIVLLSDSILAPCADAIARYKPQGVYVDESHRYAGVSTHRGRAMRKIARKAEIVRLLTGTPVPNHEGSLWGQMTALDPERWGKFFTPFAEEYLVRDAVHPSKVLWVKELPKLYAMLLERASIYRREDEFGADQWLYNTRVLELPPRARRLYEQLAKKWVLDDPLVNPANAGVRLMRLQQLTSGFLVDEATKEVEWIHTERIDAVLADLEEVVASGKKAVLYFYFNPEGEKLYERAQSAYSATADVLYMAGVNTLDERDSVFRQVAENNRATLAIVQTDTGGVGRSFAAAGYSSFLSRNFSFVAYKQASDRMWEEGVPKFVTNYVFKNTVDMFVDKVLARKQTVHDALSSITLEEAVYGIGN